MTDGDVNPVALAVPGAPPGEGGERPRVHGGFYRNQRATWFDVERGLQLALAGRSILEKDGHDEGLAPVEAIYVTGHSLGAAMAAIAAIRIVKDDAFAAVRNKLRGVYTYGQPMVGNKALAERCGDDAFLGNNVFRHIYKNDIVPVLPPRLAGDFHHFGPEYHATTNAERGWTSTQAGDYVKQLSHFTGPAVVAASAFAINQVPALRRIAEVAHSVPVLDRAGLLYSLYDHGTANYIECSQPEGLLSEFGDF